MDFISIIFAAGRGSRMKKVYDDPKPILPLAGKPAVLYVCDAFQQLDCPYTVVVKHQQEKVRAVFSEQYQPLFVEQGEQKGTGAAFRDALATLENDAYTHCFVCNSDDTAFLTPDTIQALFTQHTEAQAVMTVMTVEVTDPTGLGRIIKKGNALHSIINETDASEKQKSIQEINTGMYCFDIQWAKSVIDTLPFHENTEEYYITDLVDIALQQNKNIHVFPLPSIAEFVPFNTPQQYKQANDMMKKKLNRATI